MAKAIAGAALLAGAVALDIFTAGLATGATAFEYAAMMALYSTGLSMEMGAIADALTSNRGMNITTRQAASYRQVVYGTQRVGGVTIYRSTTGNKKNQYNFVIVIAGHVTDSIVGLYLDGRQVHFDTGSGGYSVRNGVGFGGSADGNSYTGPNGVQYNFGGLVYCEARYGDQSPGDVISGLTANDSNWGADGHGNSPWVAGCTYVYLKCESDASMFPGEPEIRFTVRGKNDIWDPRTSTHGFTCNWALVAADVITDTQFGLGDPTVNQDQLIAAANVCDESVPVAANGGTDEEFRYACNYHYDTSTAPGDVLNAMMPAAAGRMSRIGGEWYLWPAYWQGPSFSFNESNLTGPVEWKPYRSYRDLFNRVNGTYTAPNFPWNVAGNLYDANGFYNGMIQDNFSFAFQPTNYPQYAADVLHGYASDEYLNADGRPLPKELSQSCVLSVAQAQRVAKIYLLRNRQQGSGTFSLNLTAWQMQPTDTFLFTYAQNGWTDKVLEVDSVKFSISQGSSDSPPSVRAEFGVIETAASVYDWDPIEELTVYNLPAIPTQNAYLVAPPTNMALISSAATAVVAADGTVTPRIEVTWDTPLDVQVKKIQIQYQLVGASVWLDVALVDFSLNLGFVAPVVAGSAYNVRIRSLRANGAFSAWVSILGFTSGYVLSSVGQSGYGIGSLIAEAYSGGTAAIFCEPFTGIFGNRSIAIFPSGAVSITGLAQKTLYYVYYIDPTTAGGNVTPIATLDSSDFLGKPGYFLIDSVVTPFAASGGGGGGMSALYYPSAAIDAGTRSTVSPGNAFDGDASSFCRVSAQQKATTNAGGDVFFQSFPSTHFAAASTLNVDLEVDIMSGLSSPPGQLTVNVSIGGTLQTPVVLTTLTSRATYQWTIPTATYLDTIQVEITASANPPSSGFNTVNCNVYEIYVQS